MKYYIEYEENGQLKTETYMEMKDVGMAFAWCQKEHSGARMVRGIAQGIYYDGHSNCEGRTFYDPPPVQLNPVKQPKLTRALRKHERGCEFPFYDEVENAAHHRNS